MKEYWELHRKQIITTATCAFVALLVLKFFDLILVWGFVIAVVVVSVLTWNHYAEKHSGSGELWKKIRSDLWD